MKNATHRVVILKDLNSALISQAILFLKDASDVSESKIVAEAERIVEKYMKTAQNDPTPIVTRKKPTKKIVALTVCAAVLLTAIISAVLLL